MSTESANERATELSTLEQRCAHLEELVRKVSIAQHDQALSLSTRLHTKVLGHLNTSVLSRLRSIESTAELREIIKSLVSVTDELRSIENELYPLALKTGSFSIALDDLVEELREDGGINFQLTIDQSLAAIQLPAFKEFQSLLLLHKLCQRLHVSNGDIEISGHVSAENMTIKFEFVLKNCNRTSVLKVLNEDKGFAIVNTIDLIGARFALVSEDLGQTTESSAATCSLTFTY